MRHRHRCALGTRVPAPQHQLVVRDMFEHRLECAVAVVRGILDSTAELSGREANEHHLLVRGWQMPVRRARWCMRAIARWRIRGGMTRRAWEACHAAPVDAALYILKVRQPVVELQ